jgi:hypothetical protein
MSILNIIKNIPRCNKKEEYRENTCIGTNTNKWYKKLKKN